jgi:hypothetical protein
MFRVRKLSDRNSLIKSTTIVRYMNAVSPFSAKIKFYPTAERRPIHLIGTIMNNHNDDDENNRQPVSKNLPIQIALGVFIGGSALAITLIIIAAFAANSAQDEQIKIIKQINEQSVKQIQSIAKEKNMVQPQNKSTH